MGVSLIIHINKKIRQLSPECHTWFHLPAKMQFNGLNPPGSKAIHFCPEDQHIIPSPTIPTANSSSLYTFQCKPWNQNETSVQDGPSCLHADPGGKGGEGMKTNWSRRKRYQVFLQELQDKPQLRCSAQDFNSFFLFFFFAGFSEGDVRDIIWPGVQFLCASHVCFITSIWKNCKWCQSYLKLNNIHL